MSLFRVNVVATNPKDETRRTAPIDALVDTGSELTWLPADVLDAIGIDRRRQRMFHTAAGQVVARHVGYAILASEGYETTDEVVLAERGEMVLLGVRTIEGSASRSTTLHIDSWRKRRSLPARCFPDPTELPQLVRVVPASL